MSNSGWSYKAGEKGRNRVRAYEDSRSGNIFLELYDDGKRTAHSTGHADRERAKVEADMAAAKLAKREPLRPPQDVTLRQLFDIYGSEVTRSTPVELSTASSGVRNPASLIGAGRFELPTS